MIYYKGRSIDYDKPVKVYRNLNDKTGNQMYSIQQGGLVVAHANSIELKQVEFKVNMGGYNRYIKTGVRNAHAFAIGYLRKRQQQDYRQEREYVNVKYIPKIGPHFYGQFPALNGGYLSSPIKFASRVVLSELGVKARPIFT